MCHALIRFFFPPGFCSLNVGHDWSGVDVPEKLKTEACAQKEGSRVIVKGKVCKTPKEAKTSLLTFLTTSDWHKRKLNYDIPYFTVGSYVSVTRADPSSHRGRTRFVGICIAKRDKGLGSTFVLRNYINRMGVEMQFQMFSPMIQRIQVLKLEKRKYDELYFLRDRPPEASTVSENMQPLNNKEIIYNNAVDKEYERKLKKRPRPRRHRITDYF